MSQENVEVVLASIDAYNADDLEGQLATYAQGATIIAVDDGDMSTLATEAMDGRDALRRFLEQERETWRGRYDAFDVRPVGADRVLCRGRIGGIGNTSGLETYREMSTVFTVSNGLITRLEFYPDLAAALKAVGLEE